MTNASLTTVALVGSWADVFDDRRSVASELASVWPRDVARVTVFADIDPTRRAELAAREVMCWPEGAFGRHFTSDEFEHGVVLIGPRLDSILSLGRAVDRGCHVWLQHDVVDANEFPIDAPDDWLSEVIGAARSVIVGSDWLAGVVRRLSPDGPPILVMPPAHPVVDPIVDPPGRTIVMVGGDPGLRRSLADSLSVSVIGLDDVPPSERETRVLSARAGVEIHTAERGFASTTVTHMMARGVPTITNLSAHGALASTALTDSGLVVIADEGDDLGPRLVALLQPLLDDDREWLAASTAAKTTASTWTWGDAADVLAQWISVVDALDPSTVRVVGAVAS